MVQPKISVVIIARNESANIKDCIESCGFDKEVVVVDDYSTDDTADIARALGAKVYRRGLDGDWGAQKTFAVNQASCDWVFLIDADERCTPELSAEMVAVAQSGDYASCSIERRSLFRYNRANHGALRPDRVCRFFPKEGSSVVGKVHESVQSPYPERRLKSFMYHYTYDNWNQYFDKFNKYTSTAAEAYRKRNKPVGFFRDIVLRPLWGFFKVYFIHKGFLDGRLGWIMSVNHAFYIMTKYVKLYYLYKSDGKF